MKAREYDRRVEFWQTSTVADGYGGNTLTESLVATSWAKIRTPNKYDKLTELGVTDPQNTIIVYLRKRSDIDYNARDMVIKYRNVSYVIQNRPLNVDFLDTEIEIIATVQKIDTV